MAIAYLGYRVDSDQVAKAEKRLDRMDKSAGRAEKGSQGLTSTARRLAVQLGAVAAAATAVRGAFRSSQQYQQITNLFRGMGQSASEAAATLQSVADVANRTRAPLEATAQLYQRVSIAGRDLGASSQDVLRFSENVGLALASAGVGAGEARGALLQLSQAMASGVVRAEEFNSILEGAFPIAQAAANGIDAAAGSVGRLRNLVIEGKVSSEEFFNAIISQTQKLEESFAQVPPTISQAFSVLGNNLTMAIGQMDAALGVSSALAEGIILLANNIDQVAGFAISASIAITVSMLPAIVAMTKAIYVQVAAWITLRGVMIASGIGAFIVIFGTLVNKIIDASTAVGGFGRLVSKMGEVFSLTIQGMISATGVFNLAWDAFVGGLEAAWLKFVFNIQEVWTGFLRDTAKALSVMPGMAEAHLAVANAAITAGSKVYDLRVRIEEAQSAAKDFNSDASSLLANAFNPALKKASQLLAMVKAASNVSGPSAPDDGTRGGQDPNAPVITSPSVPEVSIPSVGGGVGGGGGAASTPDMSAFEALRERLQTEREMIEEWRAETVEATNIAREQERISQQEHNDYMLEIERLYQEQLNAMRREKRDEDLGHYESFFGQMAGALQAGGSKMLKISKAFALAEAAVSIWRGAAKALELPFPANLSAWATVLATGAKALAGIKGTSAGSAGGSLGGRSASAASASTQPREPQRTVRIEVQGEGMFAEMLRENVDQIADAVIGNTRQGGAPIMVGR